MDFMIYVGIDVASIKHDIIILNELGIAFKKAFSIINQEILKVIIRFQNAVHLF